MTYSASPPPSRNAASSSDARPSPRQTPKASPTHAQLPIFSLVSARAASFSRSAKARPARAHSRLTACWNHSECPTTITASLASSRSVFEKVVVHVLVHLLPRVHVAVPRGPPTPERRRRRPSPRASPPPRRPRRRRPGRRRDTRPAASRRRAAGSHRLHARCRWCPGCPSCS